MLSNTDLDGKKALSHIKFSTLLGTTIPLGMAYTSLVSPIVLPFYYFYFKKAYQAVKGFEADPSSQNAKQIKVASYLPFFILLAGIYSTILYNKAKSCMLKAENGANVTEQACVYKRGKEMNESKVPE